MTRVRRGCLFAVPGALVFLYGLFYVIVYVGIPPQDPPPAIEAEYERRGDCGDTIMEIGFGALILGAFAAMAWPVAPKRR